MRPGGGSWFDEKVDEARRNVRRLRAHRGEPCEFVPSRSIRWSLDLDNPDVKYYLWWRDNADRGVYLKADIGYVTVYGYDLLESDLDPETALERVRGAVASLPILRLSYAAVLSFPEVYVALKGLSPDLIPREAPFHPSEVAFVRDLTRYPMRRPDPRLLRGYFGYQWAGSLEMSEQDMTRIVFLSLTGMDEIARSSEGRCLLRSVGCDFRLGRPDVPAEYEWLSGRLLSYPRFSDDAPLRSLVDSVVRTVVMLLRADGKRGPQVPRSFPERYRRVVAAAADAVVGGDPWDASSFRADGESGFWDDDGFEDLVEDTAVVHPQPGAPKSRRGIDAREVAGLGGLEPAVAAPYVPSGYADPRPGDLDDGRLAFYASWRAGVRRGEYGPTDAGYLWLLTLELVTCDRDPGDVQKELRGMCEAYLGNPANEDAGGLDAPLKALADHSLQHGFDVPTAAWRYVDPEAAMLLKLDSDPVGRICVGLAESVVDRDYGSYAGGDPALEEEAVTAAVRAVDASLRAHEGKRIADLVRGVRQDRFRLYEDFGGRGEVVLRCSGLEDSTRVKRLVRTALVAGLRAANRKRGRPVPRYPADVSSAYADEAEEAAAAAVDRYDEEARREASRRAAEGIVLDRDAVRSAADDLDAVTGMMAVDEAPEEAADAPEDGAAKPRGDPWESLRDSLDEVEASYLLGALSGRASAALAGTGRRPSEVEESVNNKSMDAVGDAVVEDGEVFEEYREDVGRMLDARDTQAHAGHDDERPVLRRGPAQGPRIHSRRQA